MATLNNILEDSPWILKVNVLFAILFFLLVAIIVLALVFLRKYKNGREQRKRSYQDRIDAFLNNYLFDEQFDFRAEVKNFRNRHLVSSLQKKMAIRQILEYNENLKGESSNSIKRIFHELRLDEFVLDSLKNGKWYEKSRAIHVLSQLLVRRPGVVARYLNDRHHSVRAQAIYYFIKTAEDNPLSFFAKLNKELTLWEQIHIEDGIKHIYKGPIPDFSKWLDHELTTVLVFSIRMIQQFNQFEHIPQLVPFLHHHDRTVRKETVRSLRKFNYEGLLDKVIPQFFSEDQLVKKEIVKSVQILGDLKMLQVLKSAFTQQEEWQIRLELLRAEKSMLSNLNPNL
ncbi:HEAT repeat domain-containing protein [Flagellimonas meishanensis]|uniref:HEAT repeat domain-containing protein n=1 Tax=Flagellimonas meishanensis TaxID=2873264 RepID=UPI001CA78749|nr:HEAT repeat domain-containing protein [[Muricauda] meishanensis]